jgi:hypothetical protein
MVLCIACGKPDLVFARYEAIQRNTNLYTHFWIASCLAMMAQSAARTIKINEQNHAACSINA